MPIDGLVGPDQKGRGRDINSNTKTVLRHGQRAMDPARNTGLHPFDSACRFGGVKTSLGGSLCARVMPAARVAADLIGGSSAPGNPLLNGQFTPRHGADRRGIDADAIPGLSAMEGTRASFPRTNTAETLCERYRSAPCLLAIRRAPSHTSGETRATLLHNRTCHSHTWIRACCSREFPGPGRAGENRAERPQGRPGLFP